MEKKLAEINNYIEQEALFELKGKLVPGVFGHIGVTSIMMGFTPLMHDHFWPALIMGGGIILSSLSRVSLGRASNEKISENPSRWKIKVHISLYTTLVFWCALFLFTILEYPLASHAVILITLIAAGNTANSTSALSANPVLARIFATGFMSSLAIGLLVSGNLESNSVALLCIVHLAYNIIQIGVISRGFVQTKIKEFNLRALQEDREQNRILLWGVLNALQDSVFLRDIDDTVQLVNKAGEMQVGTLSETLIGQKLASFMPEDATADVQRIDRIVISTDRPYFDEYSFGAGEDKYHISRSFYPYHDSKGNLIGILSVSRDISEIKKHEKELVHARDELEQRVEERTKDLSLLSQSLLISQNRLESVLTNAPIILWAVDNDGVITHSEGAGLEKIKTSSQALVGKRIVEFFANNSLLANAQRSLSGESFWSEDLFRGVWFESHWSVLRNADGGISGTACLSLNISERKISEEALTRSSRLQEILTMQKKVGNAGLDLSRIMEIVCKQAQDMTRADGAVVELAEGDELVYKAATGSAASHVGLRIKIAGSLSGLCYESGTKQICGDGFHDDRMDKQRAHSMNMRSIILVPLRHANENYGILKAFSHSVNVFNDPQLQALDLMGELLAASISQAAAFAGKTQAIATLQFTEKNLIKARLRAEAAAQSKADFLASMSHEIRTPLNGIIGMTELLIETNLSEEQERFARIVQNSGNGLLAIINDILDFSKIDAGKMVLEESKIDTVFLVESQADLLAVKAKEKKLSLMTFVDPRIPAHLMGDGGRISQILLNLISNAIKFTSNGGVGVQARLLELNAREALVRWEVKDTGIGISPETQLKLFTPFTQADGSTARRYGGTGLGLSISKRLVDLMGGEIGIESAEGEGATFWFTLRLQISDNAFEPRVDIDLKDFHILVVDDDPFAREILCRYLSDRSANTDSAVSGAAGLETLINAALSQNPYDLVMIDRGMEGMDGFELARLIKLDARLASCKMVLVTAFDGPGLAKEAIDAKFSAFLTKPVRKMDVHHIVGSLLRRSEPLVNAAIARTVVRDANFKGDASARILVVEDNPVNQLLAIQQLKKFGLECRVVANGLEALEAVKAGTFDLILMDCQMPEMDGYEATVQIRKTELGTGTRVPIIAMTANALREDEEKCRVSGMDDFLSKPIKREKLEAKLKHWLPALERSA